MTIFSDLKTALLFDYDADLTAVTVFAIKGKRNGEGFGVSGKSRNPSKVEAIDEASKNAIGQLLQLMG